MSYSRNGTPAKTRIAAARELPERRITPEQAFRDKWAPDFIDLMKNRMRVGAHRYHNGASQFETRECADSFLRRMREKLNEFSDTRNHEMLVDIAVYSMLLWRLDDDPRAHFTPLDQGMTDD